MEKVTEACKNFWNWVKGAEKIEVSETDLVDLANYIQNLGYGLREYGFATEEQIGFDSNTGKVNKVSTEYKEKDEDTPNYLYAYILQNERTYTLRGVQKTGFNKLLSCIPIIGNISNALEDSIRNTNYIKNPDQYGMIHFDPDSMNEDWWNSIDDFSASIDRDNNRLTIKTGTLVTSQMNWDLTGWTGRYGKPIELSLALHLSTMAPDFVYDFCTDGDLQTDIELSTQEMEYNVEYAFHINDSNQTISKEQIVNEYNSLKETVSVNANYDALFSKADKLERYEWDGQSCHTATMDTIEGTNIVKVTDSDTNETMYYKALDKDGNPIKLVNRTTGELISYSIKVDGSGKPTFTEDNGNDSWNIASEKEYYVEQYMIEYDCLSFQDLKAILNGKSDKAKLDALIYLETETGSVNAYTHEMGLYELLNSIDMCIDYMKKYDDKITWNKPDDGYQNYYRLKAKEMFEKYGTTFNGVDEKNIRDRIELDELCKKLNELLIDVEGKIQQDKAKIQNNVEPIIEENLSSVENQWGIDPDVFLLLYKVMSTQSTSVHTFKPYINKVTHHWYRDLYFVKTPGKTPDSWDSAYDFTKEINGKEDEFNPEGLADSEVIQKLNETGKIMYTLTGKDGNNKDVEQINQPYIIKDEKWHNKVKNWLTNGYYFIYDGTLETAEEIESARKYLSNFGYEPSNPLLVNYDNSKVLTDKDNNVSDTATVEEIEKKAQELNNELANASYKVGQNGDSGQKYKVRLQKISFAKKSSLAAFSILENVHTQDGEYIYHDLKEFLIELGYFTEADFKSIETGVLDWLIPAYTPEVWPDKKYEKKDNEYGTYIRSKASLDAEKAENGEEEEEEEEEISASSSNTDWDKTQTVNGVTYINYKQGAYGAYGVGAWGDWSNVPGYDNENGCGATSTAVLASGYGCTTTPDIMAKYIPYRTVEEIADAMQAEAGVTCSIAKAGQSTTFYIDTINQALSEGKPMIVCVNASVDSRFTTSAHFIVILGQKSDGTLILSNPGNGSNPDKAQYEGGVKSFVERYMITGSGHYHGIVVPDTLPTGGSAPSKKKKHTVGFEAGLDVITPGEAKVIKIDGNSITLKFTADTTVKNMTMKIEGITINSDITEGAQLEKSQVIGVTTDEDIKLLMRDEKKAIINNIEDYMKAPKKKSGSLDDSKYDFFYFTYYESGKWCTEGNGPASVGACQPGIEHGAGICQWTTMTSGLENIQILCGKLAELDSNLCGSLAKYADVDSVTLINKYAMQPTFEDSYLKRDFKAIAERDRDRFLELQMQIALEEKYQTFDDLDLSWMKERPAVVQGTLGSLVNWGPYMGWESAINESMSDEEIIISLLKYACTKTSTVGSLNSRWNPQAKAALDILHGELDAKKLLEEEDYGNEYGTGGQYVNFLSTQ